MLNGWVIMIRLTRGFLTETLANDRAKVQCSQLSDLGFHKFSRGPFHMTFFTGSPTSDWTRNYRLDYIEQP